MKLKELTEENKKMTEHKQGTYSGVRFSPETKESIMNFIKKYKIPNAVSESKLHTTVLYSRKPLPDYKAQGKINPPYTGKSDHFEIWKTRDTGKNCLVLKYKSPELVERHKYLMKKHEATYDFKEYIPHITLSYDIGDMKLEDFGKPEEIGDIVIVEEYMQPLDLDWNKSADK